MTSMVERVARAMFAVDHEEAWEKGEALTREIYLGNARVAIKAMLKILADPIAVHQNMLRGTITPISPRNLPDFYTLEQLQDATKLAKAKANELIDAALNESENDGN